MLTGTTLVNTLIDEMNDMGLPNMAASLDSLYRSERFLELDSLTLISELIRPEYDDKISKRVNNRLRRAHLLGCPESLNNCVDSTEREYLPNGITEVLKSLAFIDDGRNLCILGPSDSGKTYLAKSLGIAACVHNRVEYHHCEPLLEEMVALKDRNYEKYEKRMKALQCLDLLILDDFLLHTIADEREVKILFSVLENRCVAMKSTIVCSQREPNSWASMILNDEVAANAILKRATKHYTVVINHKSSI